MMRKYSEFITCDKELASASSQMLVRCDFHFDMETLWLSFSGEDFHPTSNSLIHGTHVPSKEGVDRMVDDLEKQ